MFSVKAENILLNYFVVLFTVGLLLCTIHSVSLLILFSLLVLAGILLYFDKYFFFKILFLFTVVATIVWLLLFPAFKMVVILILFVSLSQLCILLTYILLLAFIIISSHFLDIYLVFAILLFTLIFSSVLGINKLVKDFYSKLFLTEGNNSIQRHDFANLCTILFFKNKDSSLQPILERMRLGLNTKGVQDLHSKYSIAGILRMTVYLLNYDFNLKIKNNFFLVGDNSLWVCFFYHLLENFAKRGSTILIQDENIFIPLKGGCNLKSFLKNNSVFCKMEIQDGVLKLICNF